MANVRGKKVAILATDGFEQSELIEPKKALEEAGVQTTVVSLESGFIKGWKDKNWGDEVKVDRTLDAASADDFDGLCLPGGVKNPDTLRGDERAVAFVKSFVDSGKPIFAICHGPWTLINANGVRGRTMTSYHTIRKDLENAGATWVDQAVVTDQGLVTSRTPSDLPQFNKKMLEELEEGVHDRQTFSEHAESANQVS